MKIVQMLARIGPMLLEAIVWLMFLMFILIAGCGGARLRSPSDIRSPAGATEPTEVLGDACPPLNYWVIVGVAQWSPTVRECTVGADYWTIERESRQGSCVPIGWPHTEWTGTEFVCAYIDDLLFARFQCFRAESIADPSEGDVQKLIAQLIAHQIEPFTGSEATPCLILPPPLPPPGPLVPTTHL